MEFDWLERPFRPSEDFAKEIEESFEDPFSLRLLPDGVGDDEKARYFNLGKSVSDRGIFTGIFWTDRGKRYRAILSREMTPEEIAYYDPQEQRSPATERAILLPMKVISNWSEVPHFEE